MKLKHIQFIDEYMSNGCNATRAYMTVYKHVKETSAAELGSKLLRNVKIKQEIDRRQSIASAGAEITKEQLLKDLDKMKARLMDGDAREATAAINAIKVLNAMLGFNAPIENKNDITVKGEQPLFTDIDIKPKPDQLLND